MRLVTAASTHYPVNMRPGKGGQILPLPAISAAQRDRIMKLGKRKGTPVEFMVCHLFKVLLETWAYDVI